MYVCMYVLCIYIYTILYYILLALRRRNAGIVLALLAACCVGATVLLGCRASSLPPEELM